MAETDEPLPETLRPMTHAEARLLRAALAPTRSEWLAPRIGLVMAAATAVCAERITPELKTAYKVAYRAFMHASAARDAAMKEIADAAGYVEAITEVLQQLEKEALRPSVFLSCQ